MKQKAEVEDEEMDDPESSNNGSDNKEPTAPPPLTEAEVQMIVYKRLEDFFTVELTQVVCVAPLHNTL